MFVLKFSLLLLLKTFVMVNSILSNESEEVQKWRTTFRKNYSSSAEELRSIQNLKKNLREIELHNIRFKAGLETYSRGVWEMSDLSYEEKTKVLTGSHVNFSQITLQGKKKTLKQGPSQVNWVERGRVHEPETQGKCGSCFAFAAVAVAEGVLLKNGDKSRLSVQQIVDCDKLNEGL
jgi:C1A family cysteine protease